MKITIESTPYLVEVNGVVTRMWEGLTEEGVPCKVFVQLVATSQEVDRTPFDRDLLEASVPLEVLPLRTALIQ